MRTGDMIVYDSVMRSNMQPEEKSAIRRWAESMMGPISNVRIKDAPGGVLSTARQTGESLLTGGLLGAIHVYAENGLDVNGIPIDGLGGAVLAGASAFMGHSELASDARNIGTNAMNIWAFRQMTNLLVNRRLAAGHALPRHLAPGTRMSGDLHSDPVVAAARDL